MAFYRVEDDPKLGQDPEGDDAEFDIEIEGDDEGELFEFGPDGELIPVEDGEDEESEDDEWNANLAEELDEGQRNKLAMDLIQEFESDLNGRSEWYDAYTAGLDLVGLKIEERTQPWQNACGVFHPVLAEALIRYVSEAALELCPPMGPADTLIIGPENGETRKQAQRVKRELNYQLTKKMPENRADLEMTLWRQALAGSCFRKCYKDPILGRPMMEMVPAEDFVVAYNTASLETCGRYTHIRRPKINDIKKLIDIGFYIQYDPYEYIMGSSEANEKTDELEGQEQPGDLNEDGELLEMYVDVDLEGFEYQGKVSGIKVPYIITIDRACQTVISIYRNHDKGNEFVKRRTYFSQYKFLPGFGFYGVGLIHILGGITDAATSITRQLVDAGTLANVPSGFKSRSLRIKGDDTPLRPGELRDVDLPPGQVSKSIEWIPSKEPNPVLAQLLSVLVDEARRLGSISDMKLSDSGGANAPVGTTLALIERHMRVVSAVQARNYVSMDQELEMLVDILANDMPDEYDYPIEGGPFSRKKDFGPPLVVMPVADPGGSTMSQRIMRLNAFETIAAKQPQYIDMAFLYRQLAETMELQHADKLVPLQDDFIPTDPVCENMNIIQLRPVKAFLYQDHEAHITTHMAALNDPIIMQIVGQSPNAAAVQSAAMAHIQEHVAFAYRAKMEQSMGMSLPAPGDTIPPEAEKLLSRAIAEGAQKVLAQSQNQAAQMQAQQQAQDPLIQLRAEEVKIRGMEAETKRLSAQAKAANDQEKLALQKQIETLKGQIEMARIALEEKRVAIQAAAEGMRVSEARAAREDKGRMDAVSKAIETLGKEDDRAERIETANKDREERIATAKENRRAAAAKSKSAPRKPTKQ